MDVLLLAFSRLLIFCEFGLLGAAIVVASASIVVALHVLVYSYRAWYWKAMSSLAFLFGACLVYSAIAVGAWPLALIGSCMSTSIVIIALLHACQILP